MAPFTHELGVRFSDLDGLSHVNNAVYLTYLEEARFAFFREVQGARPPQHVHFLLARCEIDFRRPVHLHDTVQVTLWVDEVGTRSFAFRYELRVGEDVVAEARTVQVWFDHTEGRSVPVPDEARALLERYQR